jgi:hypothetical protein
MHQWKGNQVSLTVWQWVQVNARPWSPSWSGLVVVADLGWSKARRTVREVAERHVDHSINLAQEASAASPSQVSLGLSGPFPPCRKLAASLSPEPRSAPISTSPFNLTGIIIAWRCCHLTHVKHMPNRGMYNHMYTHKSAAVHIQAGLSAYTAPIIVTLCNITLSLP